ncbi:AraC family transcriptional regulator [Sinomonas sp. ASV486]|uniref:AraC family transcriptional regulator n=1 Tax=Sinomonas sp. ASV486 TaxID=3051170 RepID=UPI0027DC4D9A|nr:AraC family transcriptional regulator [Sinomonas sp. ASV486]MDQ4489283.1 AraC family transcriptional regulator [Sinomonas sp. ASV486]
MSYLRSASLRGFRTIATAFGGDADSLAARSGLPPRCLDLDDMLIPATRTAAMLELAADELECPDLGLRMAKLQSVSVLGPLAIAMTNSPSIGGALDSLARYLSVHSRVLTLSLRENPDGTAIFYGPAGAGGPVQAIDLGLGFIHRTITFLNRGRYGLLGVELPYVPAAPLETVEAFFGAPVRVGGVESAAVLRLPADLPGRALVGVNETLRQLAVAFLDEQSSGQGHDVVPRVQTAVRESLGTGKVELAGVARLMFMHPRTLQRQLAAAGVTFGGVVDDARRETALRLLMSTSVSLGQIAAMVGFTDQPSFTRAARRWWDAPPSQVRARRT